MIALTRTRSRRLPNVAIVALTAASLTGCVRETVPDGAVVPELLVFEVDSPRRMLESGAYHGTNLVFEVDLENDVEPVGVLDDEKLTRRFAPIVPLIGQGVEVYELGALHHVELRRGLWEVDDYQYPRRDRSRLYVFKEVPGDFEFLFRGRRIVVKSGRPWKPSVYYFYEEEPVARAREDGAGGHTIRRRVRVGLRQIVREVILVGRARIEHLAKEGVFVVRGTPVDDPDEDIVVHGAVRKG